jgi:3-oxoacyl-[acyl-carrier protein] reductase
MAQLQDNIAIVTGGARGIGRAIVEQFVHEGAHVVVFDKSFPDDFESFADGLRSNNRQVIGKTVDITKITETEKACEDVIEQFSRIDILVNNAGITRDKLLMRMSDEDWDLVLNVNLKGAFIMTRAVVKHMARQRRGKIVNISSVVGVMGNAGQANYAASKAGLIGMTKSVAKEFAGRSITVNAIAPGYVETEMTAILTDEQRAAFLNLIPLKRGCKPSEIADAVTFFASEKSAYITGQVLCVDGGMVM